MSHRISFDEHPELFSLIAHKSAQGRNGADPRRSLRELSQEAEDYILGFLAKLPPMDYEVARHYYIMGMSQDQIAGLTGVTQAAVSRRLKFVKKRLRSLLVMPSNVPADVRSDLEDLFPPDHVEFAFFFYFVYAQNRVKDYINTSQSGAANKLDRVIRHLDSIVAPCRQEDGTYSGLNDLQYRAMIYLDYFRFTRDKSNIITFLFKGNDGIRAGSLVKGPSIF